MYKILIACTYPINRGDELLLASLEKAVVDKLVNVEISRTVLNSASRGGVDAIAQPLGILMKVSVVMGLKIGSLLARSVVPIILTWLRLSQRMRPAIVDLLEPNSWTQIRIAARDADVAVSSAGGYLMAENSDEWLWLSHLVTLNLIRSSGCGVVSAPCSIGPFDRSWSRFVKYIPQSFDYIYLRDNTSLEFMQTLAGATDSKMPPVKRTVDLGFAHPWRSAGERGASHSIPNLGISLRYYRFAGVAGEVQLRESFESAVVQATNRLVAEFGCTVTFFSQDHGGMYSDAEYAKTLQHRIDGVVNVLEDRKPLQELVSLYGDMDVLIGVRMHACIMALSVGTPVVPIAYEPKTYGAMSDFDAGIEVLDIRNVTAEEIYLAAQRCLVVGGTESPTRLDLAAQAALRATDFTVAVAAEVRRSRLSGEGSEK